MPTQISRDTHDLAKRFAGVYQQQGRMLTDADWNELVDLLKARLDLALGELVGSGVPRLRRLALRQDAGAVQIQPGAVYIDGVRGELPGTAPLPFNSQPDLPGATAPADDARLYVDLWEREVTALEDPTLLDPGLHGADTCSRTQQMLQVKWCPIAVSPRDAEQNPPVGSAVLGASLWSDTSGVERGDPCLIAAEESARVGNYLFRLEVHDIVRHDAAGLDITLTLKWSSENGAEQHRVPVIPGEAGRTVDAAALPVGFTGDWTFELFDDVTTRHLGVHLAPGFVAQRGDLRRALTGPATPATPGALKVQYIRRWDGDAKLRLRRTAAQPDWRVIALDGSATGARIDGRDRARLLHLGGGDYGSVEFPVVAGRASAVIRLEKLVLTLALDRHRFVPGDHWLATVRENGERVAALGSAPAIDRRVEVLHGGQVAGIRHRYLLVGERRAGELVAPEAGSAAERRLDFPPLTNLTAERVGYDPVAPSGGGETLGERWDDINERADTGRRRPITVQEAIDDLVGNLESSDVAYDLPGCATTGYGAPTLRQLLSDAIVRDPDVAGSQRTKVKALWDALLCELDAAHLPYDPTQQEQRWAEVLELGWSAAWVDRFGGTAADQVRAICVGANREVTVAGAFSGPVDFGAHQLANAGAQDMFLARLADDGSVQWARAFGTAAAEQGEALVALPDGGVILAGTFGGRLDFGNGVVIDVGTTDSAFVARFDANGRCLWARPLVSPSLARAYALALDTDGNAVVVGFFRGSLTAGAQVLNSPAPQALFVFKLDGDDGTPLWGRAGGTTGYHTAYAVAVDRAGNITLTGSSSGEINLGGSALGSAGLSDILVASVDGNGAHRWSRLFGGSVADSGRAVATLADGAVLLAGDFQGVVSFGDIRLRSYDATDAFLVRLSATDGAPVWARRFSGPSAQHARAIAVDAEDRALLTGFFSGRLDLGGAPMTADGDHDGFVAWFSADGEHLRSARLGGSGSVRGTRLAMLEGDVVLAGNLDGEALIGGNRIASAGASDLFVARLAPQPPGPMTVQRAIDALLQDYDSDDIPYEIPGCEGTRDSVRRRLPSLRGLTPGAHSTVARVLCSLLCELDAGAIPFSSRDATAPAGSIGDLMVKKTGDEMTGPLTINGAGLGVTGDVTIGGDLTVRGNTTTIETANMSIEDNIVRVNSYAPQPTPAPINAGLEVFRGGTAPNAQLIWDEANDRWLIGVEGALLPIPTAQSHEAVTGTIRFGRLDARHGAVFSDVIDPGLGRGPVCVQLGRLADSDDRRARGDRIWIEGLELYPPLELSALVDPATGRFTVRARGLDDDAGLLDVDVRWWAFRPRLPDHSNSVVRFRVAIEPAAATVALGGTVRFRGSVSNANNQALTWSATEGTISSDGTYTATRVGTHRVFAASPVDRGEVATATVTVTAGPLLNKDLIDTVRGKTVEKAKDLDKTLEKPKDFDKAVEKAKDADKRIEKTKDKEKEKDTEKTRDMPPIGPTGELDAVVVAGDSSGLRTFIQPEERPDLSIPAAPVTP